MKIIEKGTFDKQGMPTGWYLDCEGMPEGGYLLGVIDEKVFVNGVEIVAWTEERFWAMGKSQQKETS